MNTEQQYFPETAVCRWKVLLFFCKASIYIKYITDISNSTQKSGCVLKNKQKQSTYTNKMHKKMSRYEIKLNIHTVDFSTPYVIISLVKNFM